MLAESTPVDARTRERTRACYQEFLTPCTASLPNNEERPFIRKLRELSRSSHSHFPSMAKNEASQSRSGESFLNDAVRRVTMTEAASDYSTRADATRRTPLLFASMDESRPRLWQEREARREQAMPPATEPVFEADSRTSASTPNLPQPDRGREQRARLSEISAQLIGVEKSLESKTTTSLQAETTRIQIFREAIGALEKKVNCEIKQRIESHRSINNMFEQQLQSIYEKLECFFSDRLDQYSQIMRAVEGRIAGLDSSISALEQDDSEERMEHQIMKCAEEVQTLKTQLPIMSENRNRLFVEKLQSIEAAVTIRFDEEKNKRLKQIQEMKDDFDTFQAHQMERTREIQKGLVEEVERLRQEVLMEKDAREQADDDIVVALKQYTLALHNALSNGSQQHSQD